MTTSPGYSTIRECTHLFPYLHRRRVALGCVTRLQSPAHSVGRHVTVNTSASRKVGTAARPKRRPILTRPMWGIAGSVKSQSLDEMHRYHPSPALPTTPPLAADGGDLTLAQVTTGELRYRLWWQVPRMIWVGFWITASALALRSAFTAAPSCSRTRRAAAVRLDLRYRPRT